MCKKKQHTLAYKKGARKKYVLAGTFCHTTTVTCVYMYSRFKLLIMIYWYNAAVLPEVLHSRYTLRLFGLQQLTCVLKIQPAS